jgi:hypothetical protein
MSPQNHEKFEWLAVDVRSYGGQASVLHVQSIDDLPYEELVGRFAEARSSDYQELMRDLKKLGKRPRPTQAARLRKRFHEIAAIDFFDSPMRSRTEASLARLSDPVSPAASASRLRKEFQNRTWVTRPRPGIDRVASAWLITRFIDEAAGFAFADDAKRVPEAVPFDMFQAGGFGHRGDDCTFETLRKEFSIADKRVAILAGIVHDADLEDEKFGRSEGIALGKALLGWAQRGVADDELLRRGIEMIDGLYHSAK